MCNFMIFNKFMKHATITTVLDSFCHLSKIPMSAYSSVPPTAGPLALLLLLLSRFSRVQLCVTPQTAAYQAPPSLGFSRQEHWSGLPFPYPMHENEKLKWSCSIMSDSSRPHRLQPTRLFHPWDFPGKSTGVGCHCLLHIISEVVDISSGNLASSLWFIQPGILRHVFCIDVKEAGWYILDILLSQFGTSQLFYIQF